MSFLDPFAPQALSNRTYALGQLQVTIHHTPPVSCPVEHLLSEQAKKKKKKEQEEEEEKENINGNINAFFLGAKDIPDLFPSLVICNLLVEELQFFTSSFFPLIFFA